MAGRPLQALAISGSLRKASTNTAALEAISRLAPAGLRISLYRDLATLPQFDPDEDGATGRKLGTVEAFRATVAQSDALIIAAPEYAHGVPGALKNALDWLVASESFAGKPVVLINTAPRAFHAQASLREILSTMAARLLPEAFASLPLTGKVVSADDLLADPICTLRLKESLAALIDALQIA